jgi:hypothetical protein
MNVIFLTLTSMISFLYIPTGAFATPSYSNWKLDDSGDPVELLISSKLLLGVVSAQIVGIPQT